MALKKKTAKNVKALALAKKLKIKAHATLTTTALYEALEAKGWVWDTESREWSEESETGGIQELKLMVMTGNGLVDDYVEHVITALEKYGFELIGTPSRPKKSQNNEANSMVWLTFAEPDEVGDEIEDELEAIEPEEAA